MNWYKLAFTLARAVALGGPNAKMLSNDEKRPTLQILGSPEHEPAQMRKPRRDNEAPRRTNQQQ